MIDYEKIIGVRTDKTIYKHENKVIKMFNHHYKKSQVLNEALNLSKVEETSLNVPKLLSVHETGNQWAIELSYIEGKSLHRLMEENPGNFDEYLNLFVDLQIQVHQTKTPILSKMNDKLSYKIEQSKLPATERIALRSVLKIQPKDLSLCHGDFFPANIIISRDNKPYIIDWAHASIGSKLADVCNTFLDLWIEFNKQVADTYLNIYSHKTNTNPLDIKSWLPIVAAARSNKGIKEEKEFLLSLVNKRIEESCYEY